MSAAQRLENKVAIITGGAAGMGRAMCERFGEEGAIVVVADLDLAGAEEVAAGIRQAGGRATPLPVDVTAKAQVDELVSRTVAAHGRLDIIMNNAGYGQAKRMLEITEAEWDRMQAVNVKGVFFGIQAAARQMIAQGDGGRILSTASIAGRRGNPYTAHYNVSKASVIQLTMCAALDLAPHGITVNAICPGIVDTQFWRSLDEEWSTIEGWETGEAWQRRTATIPLGRPEVATDVVGLVAFLASEDAGYITGQSYNVCGGLVMT